MKSGTGKSDRILFFTILFLILAGVIMIASAGVAYSRLRFGDEYHLLRRQFIFGLVPGMALFYLAQKIDYRFWKKFAFPFFVTALVLLILVFFEGLGSNLKGASRWLNLGPFSFQPSEIAKLALIFYLAAWLEGRGEKIKSFAEGLIPFILVVSTIGILVILQPDMGTLGILVIIASLMYFEAGAPLKHMFSLAGAGVVMLLALIKIQPYRMDRLTTFLDPGSDPQGIGYQISQALIALGSGGFIGLGLGHSRQKFNYLPEPVGDSIFAIIGEEAGIIGTTLIVVLFFMFAMRGLRIAKNAPDEFGRLVAIGITGWIVFQAFINIAAISGLIPLTGIPLPFISYGGTSLVFTLVAAGVLLNISKHAKN